MEKIPPEVFFNIIDNLDAPLAPYSTISRDWQCFIEARTMAEIHVKSNNSVGQLDAIFRNSRRRASLRSLSYSIILPSYSPMRWFKLPSRRERLENDTVFTRELRNLFTKLHAYDKEYGGPPFRLEFGAVSPMDSFEPPPIKSINEGTGRERNENTYIYLNPAAQDPLPLLAKVVSFEENKRWQRKLHPTILGLILRSLPALENFSWQFDGPEVRLLNLRQNIRTSLAQALPSANFCSLRDFHLSWSDGECGNHSFRGETSLVNPNTGVDDLSVALRKIGQLLTIKSLRLTGSFILSPEFFRSPSPDTNSLPESWSSLEYLELRLSPMTPDGDWYFTGNPNSTEPNDDRSYISDEEEEEVHSSDSDTEDYPAVWEWVKLNGDRPYHPWRNQPGAPALELFHLELAKSIPQMPKLRRLYCEIGPVHDLDFNVEYLVAKQESLERQYSAGMVTHMVYDRPHWDISLANRRAYTLQTAWEIPEELKQAWRNTVGSRAGSIHITNGGQRFELT